MKKTSIFAGEVRTEGILNISGSFIYISLNYIC